MYISNRYLKFNKSKTELLISFIYSSLRALTLSKSHHHYLNCWSKKYPSSSFFFIFFTTHIQSSASFTDYFKTYHQPDYSPSLLPPPWSKSPSLFTRTTSDLPTSILAAPQSSQSCPLQLYIGLSYSSDQTLYRLSVEQCDKTRLLPIT